MNPMNPIEYEYRRLRRKYWPASEAWRAAKVTAAFDAAEYEGLVKVEAVPEFDVYDEGEMFDPKVNPDISPKRLAREQKELHERIERDGVWILVSYFRTDPEQEWIEVDSVGGFIGEDFEDSGYDVDLKSAAVEALENEEAYVNKYG